MYGVWGGGDLRLTKGRQAMKYASQQQVANDRRILGNPYAHLDDQGGVSALRVGHEIRTARQTASSGRQNVDPRFAIFLEKKRSRPSYSNREIESLAIDLQRLLWTSRNTIWKGCAPTDPIQILEPGYAIECFGYEFAIEDTLGEMRKDGQVIEVAGIIDNSEMRARISRRFRPDILRFTSAHELGHIVLHNETGLHRDRSFDGIKSTAREKSELQADKFASYFLMPAKLLKAQFVDRFLTEHFSLNEETSFALARCSLDELTRRIENRRALSQILAEAKSYNGRRFTSLVEQFGVSREAMAIRLEEVDLVS